MALCSPSPAEALALAVDAACWIEAQSVPLGNGRIWATAEGASGDADVSLYRGAGGVVLFLIELAAATGDSSHLTRAREATDAVLDHVTTNPLQAAGMYRGKSALAFVCQTLHEATGAQRYSVAARDEIAGVIDTAQTCGSGIGWLEPIPFADSFDAHGETEIWDVSRGSAGVGMALLWAHDHALDRRCLDAASAIGRRLVEVATPTDAGLKWPMMLHDVGWWAPNFSHGTAGIAAFLAQLGRVSGDSRFVDAAEAAAKHLAAIATIDGQARSILHSEGRSEALFYLGWCHGPPGTARLFYELDAALGGDAWREWWVGGGEALLSRGAPATRSRGYWNNVGQCCGDAAIGELALSLFGATGDPRFLAQARAIATHLGTGARRNTDGASWVQAEHRVQPDLLEAQTGYMQGAAGVGSFLLRLWAEETGHRIKTQLPDCPFP
ncbi:MAG: lanthionine synthetase LanC family protein [Acidobacteriota bacterium]|nr:lanthionine synthetase LanC family protein [Acidobacteriota bacterium]